MPHENPLNSVTCLKMYVYLACVKQNSYPSRTFEPIKENSHICYKYSGLHSSVMVTVPLLKLETQKSQGLKYQKSYVESKSSNLYFIRSAEV